MKDNLHFTDFIYFFREYHYDEYHPRRIKWDIFKYYFKEVRPELKKYGKSKKDCYISWSVSPPESNGTDYRVNFTVINTKY